MDCRWDAYLWQERDWCMKDETSSIAGAVAEATTGTPGAVTATSATISGAVNPDGQPATYAFELGVYNGAATQYGIVFSGSAGAGSTPEAKSNTLTGLQPGTTYYYRISIHSGYGTSYGADQTFTTLGLPVVLGVPVVLGMVAVPAIAFPEETTGVRGKGALTRAQKLAKALKVCDERSRRQRAGCERRARRKYGR